MGRMESGAIELRGEVGRSSSSGWNFSHFILGQGNFFSFLFHILDIYKFHCRDFYTTFLDIYKFHCWDFYTTFFVIFWSDSPFCFTFSAANHLWYFLFLFFFSQTANKHARGRDYNFPEGIEGN